MIVLRSCASAADRDSHWTQKHRRVFSALVAQWPVSQNGESRGGFRLRWLAAVGGLVLALAAGIVAHVRVRTSGDSAYRGAPFDFPSLTSRETFGDDGAVRDPDGDSTDSLRYSEILTVEPTECFRGCIAPPIAHGRRESANQGQRSTPGFTQG